MEKHGRINIFVNVLLSGILSLITAFAGMLPSIIQHGGYFVSKADYITQQIPCILETKRMFSTGMPYWSWNSFLGDNFLGGYAFYTVGSPFVWIAILFPENHILQGITASILLKFFVCGITSFLYFRIFIKKPIYAIIGSLLYTFSSFTILNTQFNHFTDVIALFPLITTLQKETDSGITDLCRFHQPAYQLLFFRIFRNIYRNLCSLQIQIGRLGWQ